MEMGLVNPSTASNVLRYGPRRSNGAPLVVGFTRSFVNHCRIRGSTITTELDYERN